MRAGPLCNVWRMVVGRAVAVVVAAYYSSGGEEVQPGSADRAGSRRCFYGRERAWVDGGGQASHDVDGPRSPATARWIRPVAPEPVSTARRPAVALCADAPGKGSEPTGWRRRAAQGTTSLVAPARVPRCGGASPARLSGSALICGTRCKHKTRNRAGGLGAGVTQRANQGEMR
jgi:hypothetical protein